MPLVGVEGRILSFPYCHRSFAAYRLSLKTGGVSSDQDYLFLNPASLPVIFKRIMIISIRFKGEPHHDELFIGKGLLASMAVLSLAAAIPQTVDAASLHGAIAYSPTTGSYGS